MKDSPTRLMTRRTAIVGWATIFTQAALPLSLAFTPAIAAAQSKEADAQKWYQSGNTAQTSPSSLDGQASGLAAAGSALQEGNASGMARSAAAGAASQSVEQWLSQFGTARVQLNLDDDFKADGSEADLLVPLYQNESALLFTQLGYRHKDDRNTGNFGLGARYLTGDWMFGVNTFYDNDFTGDNRRMGVGVEAWRDYLKLSANSYIRLSDWHQSRDFSDYDERPANGYDIRAEGWLPAYPQLGAKVMYEQYQGDEVALFGKDNRQKDPWAFTGGLTYTPVPLVTMGVQHRAGKDGENDSQVNLQMNYRIGESWDKQLDPGLVGASRTLAGTRMDLVERNNNIVLDYRKQETLKLVVPEKTTGKAHSTVPIAFSVETKGTLQRIDWDAASLVAAGGSLTQTSNTQLSATLPAYQPAGSNVYRFAGVAYDTSGNSGSATGEIHVQVGDVLPGATKVTADPTSILANGKSTSTVNIALVDADGNTVPGMAKSLSVSLKDTPAAKQPASRMAAQSATIGPVEETSPGVYQATVTAGTRIGQAVVSSTYNKVALPDVTIAQTADASTGHIAAGAIVAVVDNSVANGAATNQVKATITDGGNNPLANAKVTFALSGSATAAPGSSLTATTDEQGVVSLSLVDKVAEAVTVTATLENGNSGNVETHFIADSSTATVNDGDIAVDKTSVVANNVDVATFTATVKDANGNPVPDFAVNWTADKGTLSGSSSKTDANGKATITLKHTVMEIAQVTAQAGSSAGVNAPAVKFTADSASGTIGAGDLLVDKTTVVANNTDIATYTALVKDANGNPIQGIDVSWTTDLGTLSGSTSATGADGKATITLKGTVAGVAQVAASVNGKPAVNADKVTFTADGASATIGNGDLKVDKTSVVADNADVATFTALVKDANGNPVADFTVDWNTDKGTLSGNSSKTDASGKAVITLKHNVAEAAQVVAQAGQSGNINAPVVNFTADSSSAKIGAGDLTVDTRTVVANGADVATFTALVKDANGNPVQGIDVNWSTDKGSLSGSSSKTDAQGQATITLKHTVAEAAQVVAQTGQSGSVNAPQVNFTADSTSGTIGAGDLSVDKTTVVANNTDIATYTALVKDAHGNPIQGIDVSWATDLGTLSGSTSATGADGKATITLKGTVAGVAQVSASVNGKPAVNADKVTFTADSTSAAIGAGDLVVDKTTLVANNSEIATYTAQVKDANGNPVQGVNVSWTTDLNTLSGNSSATGVDGKATITLKGLTAGEAQVAASVNGKPAVNADKVTFTADGTSGGIGAGDLTVDKTTAVANNAELVTYTALVKDAGGNPVPDLSVSWTTDNGTLSATESSTDASGKAKVTLKSTVAGNAQVAASVNGKAPVNASLVLFTADTASAQIGSGDLVVDKPVIVANNVEVATYKAIVKDANGNVVSGANVSWTTDFGTLSATSSATDAAGQATVTLKGTKVGLAAVTGTINGSSATAEKVSLIADATTAKIDAKNISVSKTSIISDGSDEALYTVKVTDAYDNPIPDLDMIFATDKGDLVPNGSKTDSNGVITAKITANIPGSPTSPDSKAQVTAQPAGAAKVNAPALNLVVPAQNYTGPRSVIKMLDAPVQSPIAVSGRTGTVSGTIKVRVIVVYPQLDDMTLTLISPDGKRFDLKKRVDGQTDIGDKTYTVDMTGASKPGTWKLESDAYPLNPVGNPTGTVDWELKL